MRAAKQSVPTANRFAKWARTEADLHVRRFEDRRCAAGGEAAAAEINAAKCAWPDPAGTAPHGGRWISDASIWTPTDTIQEAPDRHLRGTASATCLSANPVQSRVTIPRQPGKSIFSCPRVIARMFSDSLSRVNSTQRGAGSDPETEHPAHDRLGKQIEQFHPQDAGDDEKLQIGDPPDPRLDLRDGAPGEVAPQADAPCREQLLGHAPLGPQTPDLIADHILVGLLHFGA